MFYCVFLAFFKNEQMLVVVKRKIRGREKRLDLFFLLFKNCRKCMACLSPLLGAVVCD